jgi:hypothetical protein
VSVAAGRIPVIVKLSISVPDDVVAYLQNQGNATAAVTAAVRRILPAVRRDRQRAAAHAYGEFLRGLPPEQIEADTALISHSW